ncbi:hypothetical protein [Streptomyces sp. 5-6(2022)]|uniref:hypothetical protein n=1 Tax=Streptomyces sp. 5-6(2022) TaxID=2936510 RepID=UPI0023B93000|nr:hypothetical protein [Streptomyces sp. 5-6(2022)]
MDRIREWYDSPEYRRAREIREGKFGCGCCSPRVRRPKASPFRPSGSAGVRGGRWRATVSDHLAAGADWTASQST